MTTKKSNNTFKKALQLRTAWSLICSILGLLAILAYGILGAKFFASYPSFPKSFYLGLGFGLLGAGIVSFLKNRTLLQDEEKRKEAEILENDERRLFIFRKTLSASTFLMFFLIILGILISGFINLTVFCVLLAVFGTFLCITLGCSLFFHSRY